MTPSLFDNVTKTVDALPLDQQRQLLVHLAAKLGSTGEPTESQNPMRWEDVSGTSNRPMCGQDAQNWVRQTRQESDQRRGST
jgi:hypothetical protein